MLSCNLGYVATAVFSDVVAIGGVILGREVITLATGPDHTLELTLRATPVLTSDGNIYNEVVWFSQIHILF